jgi:hypothetical protein
MKSPRQLSMESYGAHRAREAQYVTGVKSIEQALLPAQIALDLHLYSDTLQQLDSVTAIYFAARIAGSDILL